MDPIFRVSNTLVNNTGVGIGFFGADWLGSCLREALMLRFEGRLPANLKINNFLP